MDSISILSYDRQPAAQAAAIDLDLKYMYSLKLEKKGVKLLHLTGFYMRLWMHLRREASW